MVDEIAGATVRVKRERHGVVVPVAGLPSELVDRLASASPITMVLGPKHTTVSSSEIDGPCVIRARISDVVSQGSALRYELIDDSRTVYTALASADSIAQRSDTEDTLWMRWEPDHGHLMPREP